MNSLIKLLTLKLFTFGVVALVCSNASEAQVTSTTNRMTLVGSNGSLTLAPPAGSGDFTISLPQPTQDASFVLTRASGTQEILSNLKLNNVSLDLTDVSLLVNGASGTDKVLSLNSTGDLEWLTLSGGGINYWQRVGTTLSPATAGDNVALSGELQISGADGTTNILAGDQGGTDITYTLPTSQGTPGTTLINNASVAEFGNGTLSWGTPVVKEFTIDADETDWLIDDPSDYVSGDNTDPTLTLYRGLTYAFKMSTASLHFFSISDTPYGDYFETGISDNGIHAGTMIFQVPMDAPTTLYYYCDLHAQEAGNITIP